MLFSVDYCGGVHRPISSLSIQNLVVTKLSKKTPFLRKLNAEAIMRLM